MQVMQSDLHAVISDVFPVSILQVEEAFQVAKRTEPARLADLVADLSDMLPQSLLEEKLSQTLISEPRATSPKVTTSARATEPASEFTGISKQYAHLKSYESSLEEDPSSYTKVYSKPSQDVASQEVVELSPDLDFDEIKDYVRNSKLSEMGYAVASVSEEAKQQWKIFTSSIEGFCWSVLMYDMAV